MSKMNSLMRPKVEADIARVGWSVIATNDGKHGFAYTIGLTELGLPELILFAVPARHAMVFLNGAGEMMKAFGEFKDGQVSNDFSALPTAFKHLSIGAVEQYAIQALGHYEDSPHCTPRFMQMVVPDRAGLLPWQPGFDATHMDKYQPRLWEQA